MEDTAPTVQVEGWLETRTGKRLTKRWKRRYFALEKETLVEYRDISQPSKKFPLKDIADVLIEDNEKFTFGFRFVSVRWISLRAPNVEELDKWIAALRRAILEQSPSPPFKTYTSVPTSPGGVKVMSHETSTIMTRRGNMASNGNTDNNNNNNNTRPRASSVLNVLSLPVGELRRASDLAPSNPTTPRTSSLEFIHPEGIESNEFVSSEEEDDEDSDEVERQPSADRKEKTWGVSLRRMFTHSVSSEKSLEEEANEEDDSIMSKEESPIMEVKTLKLIEYDVVEIFENQRWFPVTRWGTKFLPHDPAHWTNRSGHSRTDWYKISIDHDEKVASAAANTATIETFDMEQLAGGQLHVIREPWVWHGPWQIQPIIALNQQQQSRGGENRLRTASIESLEHSVTSELPPQPSSTKSSSVVKSFKKRFISTSSAPPLLNLSDIGDEGKTTIDDKKDRTDDGWNYGFDFPEFDHSIARGVPRAHPPSATTNVRARRLIRVRRRIVSVTGRLNDEILPMITSVLSFQKQVVAEGWLGVKKGRVWKSKYFKLIRTCNGTWDRGLGRGYVESAPTSYSLVSFECKELHQQNMLSYENLEPDSIARLSPFVVSSSENADSSMVLSSQRYMPFPTTEITSTTFDFEEECKKWRWTKGVVDIDDHPPRSGRFELTISRDRVFLLSADNRADASAWVLALNRAAKELAAAAAAPSTPSTPLTKKKHAFSFPFQRRKKDKTLSDVAEGKEDEDGDTENEVQFNFVDTGEELVPNTQPPPAQGFDFGKLKQVDAMELPISLRTFYQLFFGDKAVYSLIDCQKDVGSTEAKVYKWNELPPGAVSRQGRDDYDFDGYDTVPEKFACFRALTGAPIGPANTRVEFTQRLYYYPSLKMFIAKSSSKSLDVPFGDSFIVVDSWVVEELDTNKVKLTIYLETQFLRNIFLAGTIRKSAFGKFEKFCAHWRKKCNAILRQAGGPKATISNDEENEISPQSSSEVSSKLSSRFSALTESVTENWKILVGLLFVYYMIRLLWSLERIAVALESNKL